MDVAVLAVDLDASLIARCRERSKQRAIRYEEADVTSDSGLQVVREFLAEHSALKFDLVTCFSVTMWIHLNHGDAGLKIFLENIASLSNRLLIEPQPWTCYKTARRRMRKLKQPDFPHMQHLQWTSNVPDDIVRFLTSQCNMKVLTDCGTTSDWNRPVHLLSSLNS